jgi:hypothetical protein
VCENILKNISKLINPILTKELDNPMNFLLLVEEKIFNTLFDLFVFILVPKFINPELSLLLNIC